MAPYCRFVQAFQRGEKRYGKEAQRMTSASGIWFKNVEELNDDRRLKMLQVPMSMYWANSVNAMLPRLETDLALI